MCKLLVVIAATTPVVALQCTLIGTLNVLLILKCLEIPPVAKAFTAPSLMCAGLRVNTLSHNILNLVVCCKFLNAR